MKIIVSGHFRIEFSHLHKDRIADPPLPGAAFVTITKEDGVAGKVSWSSIHEEGDVLGRPRKQAGSSAIHKVFSRERGRFFEVDFDTGITLLEITPNQVVGGSTGHGWRTFTADEIVLKWANGTWEVYHLGSEAETIKPDRFLPRGENTEKTIAWMLSLADDGWLSRNPKVRREAQEIYRKLLKEHSKAAQVKRQYERINGRARAVLD